MDDTVGRTCYPCIGETPFYMRFLGFDCANRSFAYSLVRINVFIHKNLELLADKFQDFTTRLGGTDEAASAILQCGEAYAQFMAMVQQTRALTATWLIVEKCGVIDMLGTKVESTDKLFRARCLKTTLDNIAVGVGRDDKIIIEDQPASVNVKSSSVADQLCLYFADYDVELISPTWKNKLCFREGLDYATFRGRVSTSYAANKRHSKENFLYLLRVLEQEKWLLTVDPTCYDDLADSCMQIIAYVAKKYF